jgi:tetratricopeptide (TPR) repeat protein
VSEGIFIALIGFTGAILGALITASAKIYAERLKAKSTAHAHRQNSTAISLIVLFASVGAAFGCILALVFALIFLETPKPDIKPTSTIAPPQSIPVLEEIPTSTPLAKPTSLPTVASQSATAYFEQGATCQRNGDNHTAISIWTTCIELYPSYGDCYNGLGMAYREIGDFPQSLTNHKKAIELNPTRYDYYWERGVTHQRMTDYESSIRDFETCIERNPSAANCYNGLGMNYRDKTEFGRALTYHNKAIELKPNQPDFYWERGITYEKMGEQANADADFVKARQLGFDG